jgi:hypothetical protein
VCPEIKCGHAKLPGMAARLLVRVLALTGNQETKRLCKSASDPMLKNERMRSQTSSGIVKLKFFFIERGHALKVVGLHRSQILRGL